MITMCWHCIKCFTNVVILLILTTALWDKYYYYPHFMYEGTEYKQVIFRDISASFTVLYQYLFESFLGKKKKNNSKSWVRNNLCNCFLAFACLFYNFMLSNLSFKKSFSCKNVVKRVRHDRNDWARTHVIFIIATPQEFEDSFDCLSSFCQMNTRFQQTLLFFLPVSRLSLSWSDFHRSIPICKHTLYMKK